MILLRCANIENIEFWLYFYQRKYYQWTQYVNNNNKNNSKHSSEL